MARSLGPSPALRAPSAPPALEGLPWPTGSAGAGATSAAGPRLRPRCAGERGAGDGCAAPPSPGAAEAGPAAFPGGCASMSLRSELSPWRHARTSISSPSTSPAALAGAAAGGACRASSVPLSFSENRTSGDRPREPPPRVMDGLLLGDDAGKVHVRSLCGPKAGSSIVSRWPGERIALRLAGDGARCPSTRCSGDESSLPREREVRCEAGEEAFR